MNNLTVSCLSLVQDMLASMHVSKNAFWSYTAKLKRAGSVSSNSIHSKFLRGKASREQAATVAAEPCMCCSTCSADPSAISSKAMMSFKSLVVLDSEVAALSCREQILGEDKGGNEEALKKNLPFGL